MWCTIAVFDDREWRNLTEIMGNPAWSQDDRFATLALRKQHEDELEKLVEAWVVSHGSDEAMTLLQSAGIRAGVVETPDYFYEKDPQLKARGYFAPVTHSIVGTMRYPTPPARLSLTPHQTKPAPCLGEHNEYLCCQVLGKSDTEFVELVTSGVLG
jgi:crotonobetainyl-CoA:carnitine CoA-transferase CaiB-like acyl-CoA transferase